MADEMDYEGLAEQEYGIYRQHLGVKDKFYDLSPIERKAWIAVATLGHSLSAQHLWHLCAKQLEKMLENQASK